MIQWLLLPALDTSNNGQWVNGLSPTATAYLVNGGGASGGSVTVQAGPVSGTYEFGYDPGRWGSAHVSVDFTASLPFYGDRHKILEFVSGSADAILPLLCDLFRVTVTGNGTIGVGATPVAGVYLAHSIYQQMPCYFCAANGLYLFLFGTYWYFTPNIGGNLTNSFSYSCADLYSFELPLYPPANSSWFGNGTFTGSITTSRGPIPVYDPSGSAAGTAALAAKTEYLTSTEQTELAKASSGGGGATNITTENIIIESN